LTAFRSDLIVVPILAGFGELNNALLAQAVTWDLTAQQDDTIRPEQIWRRNTSLNTSGSSRQSRRWT
jgi:hypothetical protein